MEDVIQARKIEIVDRQGRPRIRLEVADDTEGDTARMDGSNVLSCKGDFMADGNVWIGRNRLSDEGDKREQKKQRMAAYARWTAEGYKEPLPDMPYGIVPDSKEKKARKRYEHMRQEMRP